MVYTSETQKPRLYTGEFKYQSLFEFINVFSQQFIPEKVGKDKEEQPWLFQEVAEMTSKSHKDICTGGDKVLCFIYFSEGPIKEETLKQLEKSKRQVQDVKSEFAYKVSWIDSKKHPNWAQQMSVEKG